MAKLALSLSFLLLIHCCLAREFDQPSFGQENVCQIQRINALEPIEQVQSEAGFTEFFDSNEQQFQCAGVEVIRHQIQPRGLLLPSYTNTPILFFVERGSGIQGVMLPGCPETYEVSQTQIQGGEGLQDRHQKLHHFRQGDVVAIPTGAAHWIYNDGQDQLVIVALLDSNNYANQLDPNHRRFFLAGNSQQERIQVRQNPWRRGQQGSQSQQKGSNNIFQGFTAETLSEAFNIDIETAEMLRGENDQRGHIVMVQRGLQMIKPSIRQQQQQQQQRIPYNQENGIEETICLMKLVENINDPSKADFYNPQAGRCTNLNSLQFPILQYLKLNAERGVLHRYGVVSPYWITNAHSIIYVTNGDLRLQIVNDMGQSVFNQQIYQGQLVVVPQNFAVVKQAGEQGASWISFRTNDNAMISTLAGKTSAIRALPLDVIANSFRMSREEAHRLKYSREEAILFTYGGQMSSRRTYGGGM